jgi:D-alanyl-D-alanine dipeptidase
MRHKEVAVAWTIALAATAQAEGLPYGFVDAGQVIAGVQIDARYAGTHNFIGRPVDGYQSPRCILTGQAASALAAVQTDLQSRGLGLKLFDCYRPARAVAHFVRWAHNPSDTAGKAEFYPQYDKRSLFGLGFIASRSGHSRGSTVDLTLVQLGNKAELDMGTAFDTFSPRSATNDPSITHEQHANRQLLAAAMARRGFRPYFKEWWHFTLRGEPFPDTYFNFPVR